jgi:hypothetical protein
MKRKELELIDQYLEGTLSQQTTASFELRLRDDGKFRVEFDQIKFIIEGIRCSVLADELSRIEQLNRFLEMEGILLRHNIDGKGQNVMEDLSIERDWRVVLICETRESCTGIIRQLIKNYPGKFQAMETYNGHFSQRTMSEGLLKEPVVPVCLEVKKEKINFHY